MHIEAIKDEWSNEYLCPRMVTLLTEADFKKWPDPNSLLLAINSFYLVIERSPAANKDRMYFLEKMNAFLDEYFLFREQQVIRYLDRLKKTGIVKVPNDATLDNYKKELLRFINRHMSAAQPALDIRYPKYILFCNCIISKTNVVIFSFSFLPEDKDAPASSHICRSTKDDHIAVPES